MIVYIDGFNCDPHTSTKAKIIEDSFHTDHKFVRLTYDAIPCVGYTNLCYQVENNLQNTYDQLIFIGFSLGGFWANVLAKEYNGRAILINPIVDVANTIKAVNKQIDGITIVSGDLDGYSQYDYDINTSNIDRLILLTSDDDVIDYNSIIDKYSNYSSDIHTYTSGGHIFENFDRTLPELTHFLDGHARKN